MLLRAIIVEDEPLARERLRELLAAHADVDIVSEFTTVETARQFLSTQTPDVIFLDVQLGQKDSFSIANIAPPTGPPYVIFTTAYWQHAVRAFETRATDYIVKPIEAGRLQDALDRVRTRLQTRETAEPKPRGPEKRRDRLAVRSGDRSLLVRIADIDWIESVGNYVKLHTGSKGYLLRMPLYSMEEQLGDADFVRIHRKFIVNVNRVSEITRGVRRGEFTVRLTDGTSLKMQSPYAANLRAVVGSF